MLVRIVKMTFKIDKIDEFLDFLEDKKPLIRNFPGCRMVEILQDLDHPTILMTHSYWESAADLEKYRNSELFKFVWANTKIHFDGKPEAFSMLSLDKL
jgi:heme-degrading monooxygenase HmoA